MLNENIKAVRKSKGLSQEELAVKVNVVRQTISKWEQGLSVPDSDMLLSISEALETPVSTLLGETVMESKVDDLKAIAEKLEIINLQLAQRNSTRRKTFHWLLVLLCAIIVIISAVLISLNSPYLGWNYEDERVARDYILQDEAELIVNIVDASNLERNLYLTTQLLEMQVPMIVVLNMLDMAAAHQIEIDPHKLSEALGCPVIGIVAAKEQGLKELCAAIDAQLDDLRIPKNPIVFADDVEAARAEIAKLLSAQKVERAEWTAEQLLEGDAGMGDYLKGVDLTEVDKIIVNSFARDGSRR